MAGRSQTGDPSRSDDGSVAGRDCARGREDHEAPDRLEVDPTALRAAIRSRGLFLANAEPQVHRRRLVSPGASLGVHATPSSLWWIPPPRRTTVLPTFKAELQSIVEECQPESTIVIMADAKVQRVDRFERGEAIEFNVEGFGGTDFRPAFEHVDREQLDPACLIYLTDGDGVYPEEPSAYPTLWAITTPDRQAPWGETVTIEVTSS